MKRVNLLLIMLLITGTTMLSSCTKEEAIEKSLWSKGGEWKIESLTADQVSTNTSDNFNETINNYGTLIFKEEGSGKFTITVDGDVETGNFIYTNTEEKLTIIIDNEERVFTIVEWKKDEMKLSTTKKYRLNGETITYTETLNLKKK